MPDKKFNLKHYVQIDGDEHIDAKLQESHKEAPNVINEQQLEVTRVTEKDVTTEKQLESQRNGGDDEITEKRLDTRDAKFANKYRNEETYTGDINKLEEKRLTNDPVENEKYEPASEIPKQLRWWEKAKSPDGLKLAQKKTAKIEKVAAVTEDFEVTDLKLDPSTVNSSLNAEPTKNQMDIMVEKDILNEKVASANGIYMVLSYNPADFNGDETKIKTAALKTVAEHRPSLEGHIVTDDFFDINEDKVAGTIKLRALGEHMVPVLKASVLSKEGALPLSNTEDIGLNDAQLETGGGVFTEEYKETKIKGTPMAIGTIKVNIPVNEKNKNQIIQDAVSLIREKHPNLAGIDEGFLDSTRLGAGGDNTIRYTVGSGDLTANVDNFDVIVLTADSKKN